MKKDIIINLIVTIGVSSTLFLLKKNFALYLEAQNLKPMNLFSWMIAYLYIIEFVFKLLGSKSIKNEYLL